MATIQSTASVNVASAARPSEAEVPEIAAGTANSFTAPKPRERVNRTCVDQTETVVKRHLSAVAAAAAIATEATMSSVTTIPTIATITSRPVET